MDFKSIVLKQKNEILFKVKHSSFRMRYEEESHYYKISRRSFLALSK